VHVEGQIGKCDLGLGAGDADGADKEAHFRLLMREHMLYSCADFGPGGVAAPNMGRHRPPLGFSAVDVADPAMGLQRAFVALAAVGGIGQTSEAVLSSLITSRSIGPSWRAPSVTLPLRMKPNDRQIEMHARSSRFDGFTGSHCLMRWQIVEDDGVTRMQRWRQNLLGIGSEPFAGHGTVQDHRRSHTRKGLGRNANATVDGRVSI